MVKQTYRQWNAGNSGNLELGAISVVLPWAIKVMRWFRDWRVEVYMEADCLPSSNQSGNCTSGLDGQRRLHHTCLISLLELEPLFKEYVVCFSMLKGIRAKCWWPMKVIT